MRALKPKLNTLGDGIKNLKRAYGGVFDTSVSSKTIILSRKDGMKCLGDRLMAVEYKDKFVLKKIKGNNAYIYVAGKTVKKDIGSTTKTTFNRYDLSKRERIYNDENEKIFDGFKYLPLYDFIKDFSSAINLKVL